MATSRKLELFMLNGHQHREPIDYGALFRYLAQVPARLRSWVAYGRLIALGELHVRGDLVQITAYEGPVGEFPLIYSQPSAEERIEELARGEVLATKTRALVSLVTHEMAVEYNHKGAKAADIVDLCQRIARRDRRWEALDLTVAPIPQKSFLEALDRFELIKSATVKVTEPNPDWTKDYKNLLSQMSDDSNARTGEITLHAERRGSLSKIKGLVAYLKEMAFGTTPSVEGATVTGIRKGETAETSVSLKKHVESQVVRPRLTSSGQIDESDIQAKLREYLASRKESRD